MFSVGYTHKNSLPKRSVRSRTISDYSPFGVLLPERAVNTDDFRYGFQAQEHDDEVKGEGNSVNFKYRMHDSRVGRFFAVDQLAAKYPYNGSYNFSENRVIDMVELEGLEALKTILKVESGTSLITVIADDEIENNAGVSFRNRIILNGDDLGTNFGSFGIDVLDNNILNIRVEDQKIKYDTPSGSTGTTQGSIRTIEGSDGSPVDQINDFYLPLESNAPIGTINFNVPFDVSVMTPGGIPVPKNLNVPPSADPGSGQLNVNLNDVGVRNTTQINVTNKLGTSTTSLNGLSSDAFTSVIVPIPSGSSINIFTPLDPTQTDLYQSNGNLNYSVTVP